MLTLAYEIIPIAAPINTERIHTVIVLQTHASNLKYMQ